MKRGTVRTLRREIEAHGSIEVSFESLAQWTGEWAASPLARQRMAQQLKEAGFVAEPEISSVRPATASVRLRLADAPAPSKDLETRPAPKIQSRQEQKAAARAEKKERQAEQDAKVQEQIQAKLDRAAAATDKLAQEQAIGNALEIAKRNQGVLSKRWETWLNQRLTAAQRSGQIERGDWIGVVAHVQLFTDRFLWVEQNQLFVKSLDEHIRASVQTAGQISSRPTLTRMAIGSILPGTALIPGLAFQKKKDNRELYFVIEHPTWSKIVQLAPDAQGVAQQLAVQVNQAAAQIEHELNQAKREDADTARSPGYLAELRELADLHQAGVLTDEEFSAQKERILRNQS